MLEERIFIIKKWSVEATLLIAKIAVTLGHK